MNKTRINIFFTILFIVISIASVFAQKRVYGKPLAFEMPIDCLDNEAQYEKFISDDARNKSKEKPWLVISDRNNNQTYSKPEENDALKAKTIQFKEEFYVIDEKEEWIHIIKASVDKLKILRLEGDYGWVPKKNMLLWTSGMIHSNTKIHQKAFLLNRADDFINVESLKDKEIVQIYSGPITGEREEDRTIYKFYFVVKRENNRYLLSEEVTLSTYNVQTKLIGWVKSSRCADWNTRIALEPNFAEEAIAERKSNAQYRMKALKSSFAAKSYVEKKGVGKEKIFWENDPVDLQPKQLASDGKRLKGGIMRFPMLSSRAGNESKAIDIFRSGIIGEIVVGKDGTGQLQFGNNVIQEGNYAGIKEELGNKSKKNMNYNVFFVVEGTQSMQPYKDAIKDCIKGIEAQLSPANVSFGVSVYRDVKESSKMTSFLPLTRSTNDVTQFLEKTEFGAWEGTGNYPAMYYGMSQALKKGGFDKEDTNIIVLIGNNGDYRGDRTIKKIYKESNHKTYIPAENITSNLANLDVHLYAIQCENKGDNLSRYFLKVARNFMLSAGLNVFNKTYGNDNIPQGLKEVYKKINYEKTPPDMPGIDDSNNQIIELTNALPSSIVRASSNKFGSLTAIRDAIENRIKVSHKYQKELDGLFNNFYGRGDAINIASIENQYDDISAGRFGAAMAKLLHEQWNSRNRSFSTEDIEKSTEVKYQLYTEVYIPKQIQGTKHKMASYILFMPQSDLEQYIRMLKKAINSVEGSYDNKRESLEDMFVELVIQFSGDSELRDKDIRELSISDVAATMQGVYNEGLELDILKDVIIKDISNEREISNEKVDLLIQRFADVITRLEKISREDRTYEFQYSSGNNRYFWIPVEDAF